MDHSEENRETGKKGLWRIIDSIEGDKVIWIIVLLLILISVLAIFSSTSMLSSESRIDIMTKHGKFAIGGLILIFVMYKWMRWIGVYRTLSQFGFIGCLVLLAMLIGKVDLGFIAAKRINGAWRVLECMGFQIHVFEITKVVMVMYLAWALHSCKQDKEALERGEESPTFGIANRLGKSFPFLLTPLGKRIFYIYAPSLIIFGMVAPGSNSSAIFIAIVLLGTMIIGGIPFRELLIPGAALAAAALVMIGIYNFSGGERMTRIGTLKSRLSMNYDTKILEKHKEGTKEFYAALDSIRQPYGAKLAIHEGGILGKGSGNSTQKYSVTHIYSDYMFSFLIEEYGLILGGIFVILLYISLIARSSVIARLCGNEYAKIVVGGLAFLITGQAILHMLVNVDIIPMTGQTLPLISDGACAFLVFCFAFGMILSISRMARKKIQLIEEDDPDDIQARISVLEQIEDENIS